MTPTEENFIWMGRRLAYLGEYESAIDEYTRGLMHYPKSYRLLRHRGHRWITLRRFDRAIKDLSRAASLIENMAVEVEPDGLPNDAGIPTSTSHTNIYYHLGLAHYLRGEFDEALRAYENCMRFVANDDMHVATAYWMYLTQRRLGLLNEASETLRPIPHKVHILENDAYRDLLMLYRAAQDIAAGRSTLPHSIRSRAEDVLQRSPDDATLGYGVGMLLFLYGQQTTAESVFRNITQSTPHAAFGHIAAEVELARSTAIHAR